MKQAVEARKNFDERAEVDDARDRPEICFAYLGLGRERFDPRDRSLPGFTVSGCDQNGSVIGNIDLRTGLFGDRPYGRSALADNVAYLLRINVERDDTRSIGRYLFARSVDRLLHDPKNVQPTFPGLLERFLQDHCVDTGDLDIHLQCRDALARTGNLEIHVAVMIFGTGDVR